MDYIDDIQRSAKRVNRSLKGTVEELKKAGIPVAAVEDGDMDVDAEIRINDIISLQVDLQMGFSVNVWVDNREALQFWPCPTLKSAIMKLREVLNVQTPE